MKDTSKRQIVRDAWRLSRPYWTSEEKLSAWGILLAVIALNLGNVYISMRINACNNAFYNALRAFDSGELLRQRGTFCILVTFAVAMSGYSLFLTQMLQIRWRRWLTRRYLDAWLADHAYYQLHLRGSTDNPDQRIAEDLNQFTA
jgi:putative ATP-binding cassette transporter